MTRPTSWVPTLRRLGMVPALCLAVALQAQAQTSAQSSPGQVGIGELLAEPGSAGLGAILRVEASPYVDGGSRTDLLPLYLYEGERFFLRAGRAGFKLAEDERQRLDLFLGRRLEGFSEHKVPASLAGMDPRNSSMDLGLAWRYRQRWGSVRATLTHDVGRESRGTELLAGYSRRWDFGRWQLRPDVSVAWRDARLNDYYYGVEAHEARVGRPAYLPGSGVDLTLGLVASYRVLDNWRLLGGVSATWLDEDVRESPIIADRVQLAAFVGAMYDFGSPSVLWADRTEPLIVKIFYGLATADTCHMARIMTLRCASIDRDNPGRIVGMHIGRPFLERINGWPLDVHGYVGVLNRDERGRQSDGWQIDAYMKAFYYGFPWSHLVETRFGFGFGFSWANRVPWHEVDSQRRRERPTSRLLNYLDPSIDVNLGDILGSNRWRRTYVGVGISHRSGIFGSSRLLGNVDGGSNYIYTYLEAGF